MIIDFGPRRFVAALAAAARIEEMHMTTQKVTNDRKAMARAMWALGDYHAFAKQTVWDLGNVLVRSCQIGPGQRVLDVAAGTGNVAIRAAEAGARVVASDLTPENFEAGKREARERGVELEWIEADAEALPLEDNEFDVVTSSLGAIFAPNHQAVADEMLRVCRPGGTMGMINFTPEGLGGKFFGTFAPYMPQTPGSLSPVMWGSEEHVRELFGNRVDNLEMARESYVEGVAGGPSDYCNLFKTTFGPVIALYDMLAADPQRLKALDKDFLEFAIRGNSGPAGGPAEYYYEYLLVLARKRGVGD
jgi:ubiquinone/menaquinone biosynthesis C-methylase UbiE